MRPPHSPLSLFLSRAQPASAPLCVRKVERGDDPRPDPRSHQPQRRRRVHASHAHSRRAAPRRERPPVHSSRCEQRLLTGRRIMRRRQVRPALAGAAIARLTAPRGSAKLCSWPAASVYRPASTSRPVHSFLFLGGGVACLFSQPPRRAGRSRRRFERAAPCPGAINRQLTIG